MAQHFDGTSSPRQNPRYSMILRARVPIMRRIKAQPHVTPISEYPLRYSQLHVPSCGFPSTPLCPSERAGTPRQAHGRSK